MKVDVVGVRQCPVGIAMDGREQAAVEKVAHGARQEKDDDESSQHPM
jgi:hypothetical protein